MSSTCEKMSDGTEMDYAYRKVTLMKDVHSNKWRQLDLIKWFYDKYTTKLSDISQQWYNSNDDKWMRPWNC